MHTTTTSKVSQLRERLARRNAERLGEESEEGFTLIELMVVLLILAILLAIAIPTFLGVKTGAQDKAAQSDLSNSLIIAKTIYTNNNGAYPTTSALAAASFTKSEPSLTFVAGAVPTPINSSNISVAVSSTGDQVYLASYSGDGRCWFAEDNQAPGGVSTGTAGANAQNTQQGDWYSATPAAVATCNASAMPSLVWTSGYPS